MLLCPDCYGNLPIPNGGDCSQCSWQFSKINNVACMLSSRDKKNPVLSHYLNNYETIAQDDLAFPFIENRYIELQAEKICHWAPSMKDKDVCDIGSGRGFLLEKIKLQKPKSVTAIDIALAYLDKLGDDVNLYQANAENLPFKEQFDIITCTDILEHVINPGGFLFSLKQALRPDAYVIIRVPYKENLINYALQSGCKYEFTHLRDFDKKNIKRLLRFSGLKIKAMHIDSYSIQTPQTWWMKTQRRMDYFTLFQNFMRKKLDNESDINLYKTPLLRVFLRPLELTIIAQK